MSSVATPFPSRSASLTKTSISLAERFSALPKLATLTSASRLEMRPWIQRADSGVAAIDAITGGLPRGGLTEVCGATSSGRASLMLAALAAATRRGEVCALVDVTDGLDPLSAQAAHVQFEKLLWVRCQKPSPIPEPCTIAKKTLRSSFQAEAGHEFTLRRSRERPLEQALQVTDLLLQSGGFGMIVIDLGDVAFAEARRIPLASWFRFQRVIESTPTILLVITQAACTQSSAALLLRLESEKLSIHSQPALEKRPAHSELLEKCGVHAEILRARFERKPAQSVRMRFETHRINATAG